MYETVWTDEEGNPWTLTLGLVSAPTATHHGVWEIRRCESAVMPGMVMTPRLALQAIGSEWDEIQANADQTVGGGR
jgi:hypothetical protein